MALRSGWSPRGWDVTGLRRHSLFVLLAVGLAVPFLANDYWLDVGITILTGAMLGLGLNVVVGYAGLLDLGYAAFFAIGAYTSALLSLHLHLSFFETLPLAVVAAGISGAIIGYPTLRLRSDYLAIVTLGFGEIVRITVTNLDATGGPNGLYGLPTASLAGHEILSLRGTYLLGFAFVLVILAYSGWLARSRLGREWKSLREDETAAEAVGVPTVRVKLLAYVAGAMVGGLAGPFFVARFQTINPTSFTFMTSVTILTVVVVGGMGSLPGVLIGAFAVYGIPEFLRGADRWRILAFSVLLILLMLFRPQGLWPVPRPKADPFAGLPPEDGEDPVAAPAAGREVLLEVGGLLRRFGGVRAVDAVDLEVRSGEILSIIGPNGAGKTTLFNCVTGLVRPEAGRVTLGGTSLRGMAPHQVVAAGMARTFQGVRLFKGMTAFENVLVGTHAARAARAWAGGGSRRGARGRAARRAREVADRLEARRRLRFVGLAGRANDPAGELPYGDQRRLEIARALASRPRLLLLDEPAAGTNPSEKVHLMELIRRVRDAGTTVVLIEHDMPLVMGISDRVVVMDQGRVIAEGTPAQVQADERVIDAYLGREEAEDEPVATGAGGRGPEGEVVVRPS